MRYQVFDKSRSDNEIKPAEFDLWDKEFHNSKFETFEQARDYMIKCIGMNNIKKMKIDISNICVNDMVYYSSNEYMMIKYIND